MAIKNVIFDFGGVVSDQKGRPYWLGLGIDKDDVEFYYTNFIHRYLPDVNRGKFTHEEVTRKLCEEFPEKAKLLKFMLSPDHFAKVLSLRFDVIDYIGELRKQEFKVYGLTNLSGAVHRSFCEQYFNKTKKDFDEVFDGVIYSYQVGQIKPGKSYNPNNPNNKRIYEILLKTYNIAVETALFIDDYEINVQMGETVGIKGIWWTKEDTLETIKQKIGSITRNTDK